MRAADRAAARAGALDSGLNMTGLLRPAHPACAGVNFTVSEMREARRGRKLARATLTFIRRVALKQSLLGHDSRSVAYFFAENAASLRPRSSSDAFSDAAATSMSAFARTMFACEVVASAWSFAWRFSRATFS